MKWLFLSARFSTFLGKNLRIGFAALAAWLISGVSSAAVRQPVVAGSFYPADPDKLSAMIDGQLAQAKDAHLQNIRAIIVPHAGYPYSGPIAAAAFRQLKGLHFDRVVVMGPAHFVATSSASISGATAFHTPLGDIAVSPKARELGKHSPFEIDARSSEYEAPEWAPADTGLGRRSCVLVDAWEHSVEVEIPFLQRVLSNFELVPVVMGEVDPEAAAKALAATLDENTLLVASSDLSHYHRYDEARKLDRRFVEDVVNLNFSGAERGEACGRIPVLTLMYIAKARGWTPHLLDLRNSGDTSGDKSRVVGYSAIVWTSASPTTGSPGARPQISSAGRDRLLKMAHEAVDQTAHQRALTALPESSLPAELREPRACFVTLQEHGKLRGCIGTLVAEKPLYQAVAVAASEAASQDPRFPPVSASDVSRLHVETSVLTPTEPLAFSSPSDLLRKLHPHVDGVVLHDRRATGHVSSSGVGRAPG